MPLKLYEKPRGRRFKSSSRYIFILPKCFGLKNPIKHKFFSFSSIIFNMQSSSFYEIELKAFLSRKQYDRLCLELPQTMKAINEETIHTTRYRPGDVRLRYSDRTIEIVCKEGDPTKICRKEVVIPLSSRDELDYFAQVFGLLNMQPDPSWIKHKREFEYPMNGFTYVVCLQNIENFAFILEIEFINETDTSQIHEPNLRSIMSELGCEPIEPIDFSNKITQYIKENRT